MSDPDSPHGPEPERGSASSSSPLPSPSASSSASSSSSTPSHGSAGREDPVVHGGPRDTRPPHVNSAEDDAVDAIVRSGPRGAIAVAGVATAIVIGLWFAFYFLVFLPRGVIR
jgi:hypothetical protein